MRNDAERIAKYIAKVVPTTVGLKVASMLTQMKSGFASASADFVQDEIDIQEICNAAPVPVTLYAYYMNFGREIRARRNRGVDGVSLLALATTLHAKYVSYGCDTAVLKLIAATVYTLTIP